MTVDLGDRTNLSTYKEAYLVPTYLLNLAYNQSLCVENNIDLSILFSLKLHIFNSPFLAKLMELYIYNNIYVRS